MPVNKGFYISLCHQKPYQNAPQIPTKDTYILQPTKTTNFTVGSFFTPFRANGAKKK